MVMHTSSPSTWKQRRGIGEALVQPGPQRARLKKEVNKKRNDEVLLAHAACPSSSRGRGSRPQVLGQLGLRGGTKYSEVQLLTVSEDHTTSSCTKDSQADKLSGLELGRLEAWGGRLLDLPFMSSLDSLTSQLKIAALEL